MAEQGRRYHTIATHKDSHLDEDAAIFLLRWFGEEKFPGVSEAKIAFWETGGKTPEAFAETCDMEGVLAVGTGWGPFDEHPSPGSEGKPGECAATLVAKALGLEDDPALEPILRYVLNSDLKGSGNPFDLASLVKVMHQQYPDDPIKVMNWAIEALEAKYQEQLRFLTATRAEFEKVAQVEDVTGPNGRPLKMVVARSDDPQMNKFARSALGVNAAIVIQQWPTTGNVQIFTNRKFGLTLYDVAQMLRLAEQEAKGKVITTDWKTLAAEGKVEGAEEWYFHYGLMALMNGSLTAKGVPPTRLSLEQITEMVKIGINPGAFEPSRAANCQQGRCTSTAANPCPWYIWGLQRCRKVRFDSRKK
jgi:hypothetical protein